jgi:hypothetical protein
VLIGIAGADVSVTELPDIAPLYQAPGQVGDGD